MYKEALLCLLIAVTCRWHQVQAKTLSVAVEESECVDELQPCYTLLQLSLHADKLVKSDMAIKFLPGAHSTHKYMEHNVTTFIIQHVHNLSITAYSEDVVTIQCIKDFGFFLYNISDLFISGLQLIECGAYIPPNMEWSSYLEILMSQSHSRWPYQFTKISLVIIQSFNTSLQGVGAVNTTEVGMLFVDTFKRLAVSDCQLTGQSPLIRVIYSNGADIFTTHVVIQNTHLLYEIEGLTLIQKESENKVDTVIKNVTFLGALNNYSTGLYVKYAPCSKFSLNAIQLKGWNFKCEISESSSFGKKICPQEHQVRVGIHDSRFVGNALGQSSTFNIFQLTQFSTLNLLVFFNTTDITECLEGAIRLANCNATLQNSTFVKNHNALHSEDSHILLRHVKFIENEASHSQFPSMMARNSILLFEGLNKFIQNKGEIHGAIVASNSTIVFSRNAEILFLQNIGERGGAITLYRSSVMIISIEASVIFHQNHAGKYGGAIFVESSLDSYQSNKEFTSICFFYTYSHHSTMFFINNTAGYAGDALYGGDIEECLFDKKYRWYLDSSERLIGIDKNSKRVFDRNFNFSSTDLSTISSPPKRVCLCNNSGPDQRLVKTNASIFPGQTVSISVMAVGQRHGAAPATIYGTILYEGEQSSHLGILQERQAIKATCSILRYTVFAPPNETLVIVLTLSESDRKEILRRTYFIDPEESIYLSTYLGKFSPEIPLFFYVHTKQCPLGFVMVVDQCMCDFVLRANGIQCDIDTQRISRPQLSWINHVTKPVPGVLVHTHCPFDYCNQQASNLSLLSPDEQCKHRRSGILCGQCQNGLSQVLGSSACKKCSNLWLLLQIPLFLLTGIVLVAFLMILNITIANGDINGLVFYANIVQANKANLVPTSMAISPFTVFLSWLNMDLGFEVCFYNGLDAYTKIWLQFLFPLYIWLIVISIIITSHYSTTAARISRKNAVPVLATLFLLSYAKMLRIIIAVLSSTILEYPDGSRKSVWVYDGSVGFLQGKHIALFVCSLLLLTCLSAPYTLILLSIRWLQPLSNTKFFTWVHKLKPFFDAHLGPYKDQCHYWTGLLLLLRVGLFLVFTNVTGNINSGVGLLVTTVVVLTLIVLSSYTGGVYKRRRHDTLEYISLINLATLSCATLYTRSTNNSSQHGIVITSLVIASLVFLYITLYHLIQFIEPCASLQNKLNSIWAMKTKVHKTHTDIQMPTRAEMNSADSGLRESLLESIP